MDKPMYTRFDAYYRTSDLEHAYLVAGRENRSVGSVLRDLVALGRKCRHSHGGGLHFA